MPADRVSVGSPGGAGENEIEAILRSVYTDEEGTVSSRQHVNDAIRECLQILARRSPQSDPTIPWQQWNDEVNTRINAQIELHDARAEIKRLRSPQGEDYGEIVSHHPEGSDQIVAPQGEDHEAGIVAAEREFDRYGTRQPPTYGFVSKRQRLEKAIAAYVAAVSSPVSGTESDTAKLRAKLDEMALVDDTRNPHDEGYMSAVVEMREWLAGFSVDAEKEQP